MRQRRLLSGADVEKLLTPGVGIAAVEDAFRQRAKGTVPPPGILGMHADEGSFHVKASWELGRRAGSGPLSRERAIAWRLRPSGK